MFGKKTKELQHKVDILEIQVKTLGIRLDSYRSSNYAVQLRCKELEAISGVLNLQAKYTALLEKLGLEEVEIKAGIKLVEKQPFGKTCEHGIPIELCSAGHAREPPP